MEREHFVQKTLTLLEKERKAEIEETRVLHEKLPAKELQRRGVCLIKLRCANRRSGLYGRTVVTFEPFWAGKELPSHNISPGDIVGLNLSQTEGSTENLATGIVVKTSQTSINVAFDEGHDVLSLGDEEQYKLMKLANDVTYKRLKSALNKLHKFHNGPATQLIEVLFGCCEPSFPAKKPELEFVNQKLDESQKEAVKFALSQKEVAVIHGPPGTGKTTTVVEVILQAVRSRLKILVCAPSNIAVDNIVERLANQKQRIVRIGHPARVLPQIQKFSLDAIVSSSEDSKIVEDVRSDLDKALTKLKKARDKGERYRIRDEMKALRKELSQRETAATKEILKRSDIVLVTLASATHDGPIKLLDEEHFDIVIIDECSQALEAACWIALMNGPKCVLAGDHLQLPPTILSNEAAKEGLEKTLMERVLKLYGDSIMRMLTVQYRMHEDIMQWSSDQLYEGKLQAHDSVKQHLLKDLPNIEDTEETGLPLLLIDTAGCDLRELDLPEEISKGNEGEADIVAVHVEKLINCGLKPEDIAVIAPYNLQVDLIRLRLLPTYPKLEIKSVDGFQGREKEAVIISMVRSNEKGEVGFLAENRRINVAVTRARRHLCIICDSETVSHDKFLKSLVDYMMEKGEVRTAHQYAGDMSGNMARPEHLQDLISYRPAASSNKGTKPKSSHKTNVKKPKLDKPATGRSVRDIKPELHPVRTEITEAQDLERVDELKTQLEKFVSNKQQPSLAFPSTFSARERFFIHQLAEEMGLLHISKGIEEERYIEVQKPGTVPAAAAKKVETRIQNDLSKVFNWEDVDDDDSDVTTSEIDITNKVTNDVECPICGKNVILANFQLHSLHCKKKEQEKNRGDIKASGAVSHKTKDHKKPSKKSKVEDPTLKALNKVDADDFDSLISVVSSVDSKCHFKKCKQSTLTLGQTCEFCIQRYCLGHHIPEVHGCGDAAKAKARRIIVQEGILYRGSGVRDNQIDPDKKAALQRRLDKKVTDMSAKRKPKKTNK